MKFVHLIAPRTNVKRPIDCDPPTLAAASAAMPESAAEIDNKTHRAGFMSSKSQAVIEVSMPDWTIKSLSPAARAIFGVFPCIDVDGQCLNCFVHADDIHALQSSWEEARNRVSSSCNNKENINMGESLASSTEIRLLCGKCHVASSMDVMNSLETHPRHPPHRDADEGFDSTFITGNVDISANMHGQQRCEEYFDGAEPTHYCKDCVQLLCDKCTTHHQKSKCGSNHTMQTAAEWKKERAQDILPEGRQIPPSSMLSDLRESLLPRPLLSRSPAPRPKSSSTVAHTRGLVHPTDSKSQL